jgi:hypothetical protein
LVLGVCPKPQIPNPQSPIPIPKILENFEIKIYYDIKYLNYNLYLLKIINESK